MTYQEFIQSVKEEKLPGQNVLKESRTVKVEGATEDDDIKLHLENLQKVVEEPEFYGNFAKLETIELIQGADIYEKPHYESQEQFMCNIEGDMSIILIPHIFRQEVAGGKGNQEFHEHE